MSGSNGVIEMPPSQVPDLDKIKSIIIPKISQVIIDEAKINDPGVIEAVCSCSATAAKYLIKDKNFNFDSWLKDFGSYFRYYSRDYTDVVQSILSRFKSEDAEWRKKYGGEDHQEVNQLCDCCFSLAYGSTLLLEDTTLRLFRGHVYGLCGPNGAGKSTLMTSIYEDKITDFPSNNQLSRTMVKYATGDMVQSTRVMDYLLSVLPSRDDQKLSTEDIEKLLQEADMYNIVTHDTTLRSLSGGQLMKIMLLASMLSNSDLLLLDEPTNHLDEGSIMWLNNQIMNCKNKVVLIVSHDFSFLESVCSDIINIENKKLVHYKGSMSLFLKKCPSAEAYYSMVKPAFEISIPQPTILQGINSNTRTILKAIGVSYAYENSNTQVISDISVKLRLSSRVGVVGQNGAGKSTLMQLLTGDLIPKSGEIWKHPNLRIGYIAQHSFNHLEMHLEKTPNEYIQWRYQYGEDRELTEKASRKMNSNDIDALNKPLSVNGVNRCIEYITGRQKLKRSFQYEIKWKGYQPKDNSFVPRQILIDHGLDKLIQAFDDREAGRASQSYCDITPSATRSHIEGVLLNKYTIDHTPIKALSDGQRVKLVIAAATWNNPHILILDEPTNFLDRSAVSALTIAISKWKGAVLMVSHDNSFIKEVCTEVWKLDGGKMDNPMQPVSSTPGPPSSEKVTPVIEDSVDKIKINVKPKKLTRNQLKAREVHRRAMHLKWLSEGGERVLDTDEEK